MHRRCPASARFEPIGGQHRAFWDPRRLVSTAGSILNILKTSERTTGERSDLGASSIEPSSFPAPPPTELLGFIRSYVTSSITLAMTTTLRTIVDSVYGRNRNLFKVLTFWEGAEVAIPLAASARRNTRSAGKIDERFSHNF